MSPGASHVGFLLGNARRRSILETLEGRGDLPLAGIAHLVRLPPPTARKLLGELAERRLVEPVGDKYRLTPNGVDALKQFTKSLP
ncbi:MAG: helix-turn-helix domain-containing protein [Euryarchaeota archaeon]|nr:helix-turn-helix domain-containing protein [Euryarchaeota archaeon]